jgi:hypothetical protein
MKKIAFSVDNKTILGDEKLIIECFLKYKDTRSDSSLCNLINAMQPTLKHWTKLIKTNDYYSDFTIYSLCRFLHSDDRPVGSVQDKIKVYKKFLKMNNIKMYDDIVYLFLEYLSFDKIDISHFKPNFYKRFLYHVAMEMKYLMFKRIRTVNQLCKREALYHKNIAFEKNPVALVDTCDYSNFINTDVLNLYEQYFLVLIQEGFSFNERMLLMHNTRKQQTKEEKELWDLLKKKLSDN